MKKAYSCQFVLFRVISWIVSPSSKHACYETTSIPMQLFLLDRHD